MYEILNNMKSANTLKKRTIIKILILKFPQKSRLRNEFVFTNKVISTFFVNMWTISKNNFLCIITRKKKFKNSIKTCDSTTFAQSRDLIDTIQQKIRFWLCLLQN